MWLAAFKLAEAVPEHDGHGAKATKILHGIERARDRLRFEHGGISLSPGEMTNF